MLRHLLAALIFVSASFAQEPLPADSSKPTQEEGIIAQFRGADVRELVIYYEKLTNLKAVLATNLPSGGYIALVTDKPIPRREMIQRIESECLRYGIVVTQLPDKKTVSFTFNDKLPAEPLLREPLPDTGKPEKGKIRIISNKK